MTEEKYNNVLTLDNYNKVILSGNRGCIIQVYNGSKTASRLRVGNYQELQEKQHLYERVHGLMPDVELVCIDLGLPEFNLTYSEQDLVLLHVHGVSISPTIYQLAVGTKNGDIEKAREAINKIIEIEKLSQK